MPSTRKAPPRRGSETDTVLRFYEVTLMPDPETTYDEPVEVRLSYTDAEAKALPPTSRRALDEAFRRAVKLERRTHHTPEERVFGRGETRFVRECAFEALRLRPVRTLPRERQSVAA